MIFNFIPPLPESNWLQIYLVSLVSEVLDSKVNGSAPRDWKLLIPNAHKEELGRRHGIGKRYRLLISASQNLTYNQAQSLLTYIGTANYYNDVLAGITTYQAAPLIPSFFEQEIKSLFEFAFGLLGELQAFPVDGKTIRDSLYNRAYQSLPGHFCPFCGIDRFDAPHPDMPRHALDHYLAISLYPLFGIHLPNLIPMCGRCNSSFKLAANMLKDNQGVQRACVDPYGNLVASISLMNSSPFGGGAQAQLPDWVIDFEPPLQEFETWDEVFGIRLRYKESLLNAEYKSWLRDFARWIIDGHIPVSNNAEVSDALGRWASLCPPLNDQGFLKRPMFEMLAASAQRLDNTGNRVTVLIRNLCMI